jgi:hypothetical protein
MSLHTIKQQLQISELFLATDWTSFDNLAPTEAAVEIEYEYEPGQKEIMRPDPSDCQQGFPAQITVQSIKLVNAVTLDGDKCSATLKAGIDLYEMLNPGQIREIEDGIVAPGGLEVDYEPDYALEAA